MPGARYELLRLQTTACSFTWRASGPRRPARPSRLRSSIRTPGSRSADLTELANSNLQATARLIAEQLCGEQLGASVAISPPPPRCDPDGFRAALRRVPSQSFRPRQTFHASLVQLRTGANLSEPWWESCLIWRVVRSPIHCCSSLRYSSATSRWSTRCFGSCSRSPPSTFIRRFPPSPTC